MNKSVLPYLIIVVLFSILSSSDGQRNVLNNEDYFYDSRYDYLDIDTLLSNKRLVRNYVDCLLSLKTCTAEGKTLKRILPEALRTKCARCTPRQKNNAVLILRRLRDNYPAEWNRLSAKWDPTGDLTRSFLKILNEDDSNNVEKPSRTTRSPPIVRPSPAVLNRYDPSTTMKVSDEKVIGNMGAPSEIKPTIQVYTTNKPVITSTLQNTYKPSYSEIITTKKPVKNRKPITTTTEKNKIKHKQTLPPATTYYPDYRPVMFKPIYAGTMDLIDHFGNKIIKTTNIVTGLLKSTVRVVAGGRK